MSKLSAAAIGFIGSVDGHSNAQSYLLHTSVARPPSLSYTHILLIHKIALERMIRQTL